MTQRSDTSFIHSEWQITVHENGEVPAGPDWRNEMRTLLPRLETPEEIIKHDHRSEVGKIHIGEVCYIVKKFTLQHSWVWFKLTSLFFPTLGEIAAKNGAALSESGVRTPRPSLLLQRSDKGMVNGSWLVYRYLKGDELKPSDVGDIVPFVKRMHQLGWVHRDPHPGNFIRTSEGLATLDPIKARRSTSPYLQAYDVVLMENSMPEAVDIYGREELGIYYALAHTGHTFIRKYRFIKRSIRNALGIRGSGK